LGYDEHGASVLIGQGMEYEVANAVDPEFTMVARYANDSSDRPPLKDSPR